MRRHFEPNREAITGEVGVEFPAERTRQIIESTKSMKAAQE
jgi:hypothetical protein